MSFPGIARRVRAKLGALLVVSMLMLSACAEPEATETELFEAAEVHYRGGNYGEALSGYDAFLKRYPASPLAPTVEMRLRNIHREVTSVMERQGSPSPVYHGSRGDQSAAAAGEGLPQLPETTDEMNGSD